jgi:hypothetical protein
MPNRRDKRDTLSLSAYLLGFEIEFIDGINRTEISRKELPVNWDTTEPPGILSC